MDSAPFAGPAEEPVFLVGSPRSGTTLLRLMLDHHPGIAFEREFDHVVALVSDDGELPSVPQYLDLLRSLRDVDFEIDESLDYRELVVDFLRQKRDDAGGPERYGATAHRHFHRLPHLWPRARYLHLVRDPRDVARSVVQKGWVGNVYMAAEFWIDAEDCWDSLAATLTPDQSIEIRYEELVTDPEGELTRVCEFIGVEFDPAMLDYTADARQYPPPDPKLASQWKRKMSARDAALVESRVQDRLEDRGYAPSVVPPLAVGPLRHKALIARGRLRSLQNRLSMYGPVIAGADLLARRLRIASVQRRTQARINAIDRAAIEEEAAGARAPSANIAPAGPVVTSGAAAPRRGR